MGLPKTKPRNSSRTLSEPSEFRDDYKPRSFELWGLNGISDKTLELHFKLYEGYVKETNRLNEEIAEIVRESRKKGGSEPIEQEEMPAYSELKRRLGFEFNGMVLHEYYFENLARNAGGPPPRGSNLVKRVEKDFGGYDVWKRDFMGVGKMRGIGWAITFLNPANGRLSNHWVSLHETGNVAGFRPILVMDVWEHAYLLDYKPSEKGKYIEAFFSNIDWEKVEDRLGDFEGKGG